MNDLIVIGGGINGAGIAADAAGRGLSVLLLEAQDLASATSSASSKLIHGGLRYLEHYEFRLVHEALKEREVLLNQAPHITKPLRFRLPHQPHLRPTWMIRLGLFLYDHLGKRVTLPGSNNIRFDASSVLKSEITQGFEYSDGWVDDARLVVLNALELVKQGGQVRTRTKVNRAWRENGYWYVEAYDQHSKHSEILQTKALVNATGPWVKAFYDEGLHMISPQGIRLIKGSHIVVPRVYDGSEAYILQHVDHRIVFVIPWLDQFSIIGTTDVEYRGDPLAVAIDDNEIEYLLKVYNDHFIKQLSRQDIIWQYSGVRPLCDDEADKAQAVTRDYTLEVNDQQGTLPLLSVFGGKLTTYRKLAEHAVDKLQHYFPNMGPAWTKTNRLPGGDITNDINHYMTSVQHQFSWLPAALIKRYVHTYGTRILLILENINNINQLGEDFGHGLYEAELKYLYQFEWVRELNDVIWRRTKLGMWLENEQCQRISAWLAAQSSHIE